MKPAYIRLCHSLVSLPPRRAPGYFLTSMSIRPRAMSSRAKRGIYRTVRVASAALALAACRPSTAPAPETKPGVPMEGGRPIRATLPPIPLVEGPLVARVVYPQVNQMIQSKDSTFIIGSVGNGKATATVNGQPVKVEPNGAFL